ncbi:hypothetical protein [Streptomyces bicolor]|uniref:hypothetical protein n=1 Tax=Streptomyces bicolor TaxID=66874 RepID=UPI0019012B52|nr:hypothetical protein [Streptomyces bicolor]
MADLGPLGQFTEGHEGDQRLAADQPGCERAGELALVGQRGDVGVEDDGLHGGGSGDVAVALGVRECQELLQFLVRLEGVGARSSRDRIGWVFFAASSSSTETRGRSGG